jgi:hypothetical protein
VKKLHPLQSFIVDPKPLLKRAKPTIIHRMMEKINKQPAKAEKGV